MKQIPEFPNYSVTEDGWIWSKKRPHTHGGFLTLRVASHGYKYVMLCKDGKRITKLVHTLIASAFLGPCPKGMECRHLNGDRLDNRIANLKWGTRGENSLDAIKHGTHVGLKKKGTAHHNAKLTENQVRLIFNSYHDGAHTQQELANYFDVGRSTVEDIIHKRTWGHLWDE